MSKRTELFSGDGDLSGLVKKARRRSLFRNILVSFAVSLLLLTGLYWLGSWIMQQRIETAVAYDSAWQYIRGANVEIAGSVYHYTPISASVTSRTTKVIEDVPIPWGEDETTFTIFGTTDTVSADAVTGRGSAGSERILYYFNGERMIEFYEPGRDYAFLPDDRTLLSEIRPGALTEVAFSFDRAYSIEEVREVFGEDAAWFWVNAATPGNPAPGAMPVPGALAYGFHAGDSPETGMALSFIRQLEWLRDEDGARQEEAERLYDSLTRDGEMAPAPGDLEISGVVVTGTPEELEDYEELQMIRAAVLGATIDAY